MSEVKRFDAPSMRSLIQGDQAVMGYEVVLASDYDDLAAEAQALREEVAALKHSQQVLIGSRNAHRDERDAARKEVADLRARVVVLHDASTVYAALDARERLFTSPENIQVALEAQSRINGKTVSEGLLRRLLDSDGIDGIFDAQQNYAAHQELRALLSKQA
ncbi:hypothetical protein [Pseudomonas aeruginosa]|uniref:hypothetical protein n=1 Tax=Pseudomonas aeruginosa TaxID=287 RepID=UPI001F1A4DEC|nr:hypothetical protein [Pseudomonas aeruginosa]